MDTPTIASYYNELDPNRRKAFLQRSIEAGEDPEGNEVRMKIWETRYKKPSSADPGNRADAFLALWMVMEFNKNTAGKFFGGGRAKKEILKEFQKTGISDFLNGSELERELIYREVYHLVKCYAELCEKDKTYGSTVFGMFAMKEHDLVAKMKADLYETGIRLPQDLGISEELSLLSRAVRAYFELKYPEERLPISPEER